MLASPTCSDGNENKNVRLDACVFFHAKRNAEKPKWAKPFNLNKPYFSLKTLVAEDFPKILNLIFPFKPY
jgi:hypothetical protein